MSSKAQESVSPTMAVSFLRPEQSRMARAALEWSLEDSAKSAGVSRRTVLRFEREHRDVQSDLIQAIRKAYESAGVRFIEDGPYAGGVVPPASPRA